MSSEQVCTRCASTGNTRTATPGSFVIELLLWLFFIVPGLMYSVWRITSRKEVCGACGSDQLVPADSPRGRQLIKNSSVDQST